MIGHRAKVLQNDFYFDYYGWKETEKCLPTILVSVNNFVFEDTDILIVLRNENLHYVFGH